MSGRSNGSSAQRLLLSLVCGVAIAGVSACGNRERPAEPSRPVEGFPLRLDSDQSTRSVAVRIAERGPHLLSLRISMERGEVDVSVRSGGRRLAGRRVTRLGENLVLLPVPPGTAGVVDLVVERPKRSGPLAGSIDEATLYTVTASGAVAVASEIADAFERETGRVADPAVDNMVANPDFASDDEVRGTPSDWFAYVGTDFDPEAHLLRVDGAPSQWRPYLETAPIPVEAGRAYRVRFRLEVAIGAVRFAVVDYDDLVTLVDGGVIEPTAGLANRSVVFRVPAAVRAVRLRFAPPEPAASARFVVSTVEMEPLPDGA